MAIDLRTATVIGGGAFGAYTSDITENPLSGLITTGIGASMGAFMNLPSTSLKEMSKVNVGPTIDISYIKQQQTELEKGFATESFTNKLNSFSERTKTPLESRLQVIEEAFNQNRSNHNSSLIQRQIKAKERIQKRYDRELLKINSKYDSYSTNLLSSQKDYLDSKKGLFSTLESNKEASYYNRMIDREEKSVSRWLTTDKGIKELSTYDKWINHQSASRKHLVGRDIYDLRNQLFNEYTKANPKAFQPILKRQKYYSERLHADKKDLFNPWFRDYKQSNAQQLLDIENYHKASYETFVERNENDRRISLERAKSKFDTKLNGIDKWVLDSQTEQTRSQQLAINKHQRKIDKITTKFNREESTYNNLRSILKTNGINVSNNRSEIMSAINGITDDSILKSIDLALNNKDVAFINQSQLKVKQWNSYSKTIDNNKLSTLTDWLQNQLGNNAIDAEQKAKMFLKRAGDGSIQVKDGTISFIDKVNNERVTIPLTSYNKDGTRYHAKGNGNYNVAHQYNPYAAAYVNGLEVNVEGVKRVVTAQDMLRGYDPETMLQFLPENKPISDILPKIESLFHYNSQEAGMRTHNPDSQIVKNNQGIVDLGSVLRYDQYGELDKEYPIRSLKQTSTKDLASERQRAFLKLADELPSEQAAHLMDGLSLGNLTGINTKGFSSLATLAPNERGETSVGNRGTTVINKNESTQLLENLIGTDRFNKQFSSSQVLNRLDVGNDKLFNSIITSLYGNDYVLGEGAGFFNMGDVDSLRISDKSIIKIPLSNNMAIAHPELQIGLTSPEGLSDYLKNNPINITNDPVAYRTDNSPISLNRSYTSGTITDGFMTDKEIRLVVDSEFNPNVERDMKFFSVGSKTLSTGISQGHFNIINEVGLAINQNHLKITSNGMYEYKGQILQNNTELQSILAQEIDRRKKAGSFIQNTLIMRSDDTGAAKVTKILDKGAKGNKVYDYLIAKGNDPKTSAMTTALLSEHKGAVDLTATLGINIEKGVRDGKLPQAFRQDFLYHFNADNFIQAADKGDFIQKAHNLVASSNIVDSYLSGQSLAVGSFNKGSSIVGKGNRAKISWAARTNLLTSGITTTDLNNFGMKNDKALYELKSMSEERRLSKNSINSVINGKESSFLNMLTQNNKPETRLELMKGLFGQSTEKLETNPFLSYNLTYKDHEVKSLNFSRLSTDRSGLYESADRKLLKDLDKRKIDIFINDLAYRDATTKEERKLAESRLKDSLNSYDTFTKKMLSGDNNLLKEGLSLYSEKSSIMEVKYIGGDADRLASDLLKKKDSTQAWFISQEDAEYKAKQLGVTLEYSTVGLDSYKGIKQPVFKRGNDIIPLASLVTREPAQGPLSSDLITWFVDESIHKNSVHNSYVPISSKIYYDAMFGDGDQDTVQTLLGDFQNKAQYDEIERKRNPIRKSFFDMTDVITAMKLKGNKSNMKSIADFEDGQSMSRYRVSGGLKGRNRKTLAAPATGLAVSYAKALELDIGHLGANSKELTQGRVMIHQLVENLLKSAHLDTDSFQLVNEQAVEKLTRMRQGYLGKKGYEGITKTQYEAELRKTLPQFLGIDSIKTDNIQGKRSKEQANKIMNSIITAELNQATTVGNKPFTPLDINEHRFSKTSGEFIDSMLSVIKEQNITPMDYESGLKHIRKSTGQVSLGMTDLIMDTLKNNKAVIGGGLAAMAGVALLGREQPTFSDSRANTRQHGSGMLRSPGSLDNPSQNNTPMGIETNPTKAGYITPKAFGAKGIKVGGDFINNSTEVYNEYNSLLDTENIQDQFYNIGTSLFGDGIRSARLQTN